jgi:hypothetical protein
VIGYIYDPILNNRTKETLYKLYTQVLYVGTNRAKYGKPDNCCFCPKVTRLWSWLQTFVLHHYTIVNGLSQWERLIGLNAKMSSKTLQVWKLLHAKTIRVIWASRCKLVFDVVSDEPQSFEQLQTQIISRVEYAMTIRANILQSSCSNQNAKIVRKILNL